MSDEAKQSVSVLIRATTKYVVKRMDKKKRDKEVYIALMSQMVAPFEGDRYDFSTAKELSIYNGKSVPSHNRKWFFFKRANPDYPITQLARQHVIDIINSIERRFLTGAQTECPKIWDHKTVHIYSEEEGIG